MRHGGFAPTFALLFAIWFAGGVARADVPPEVFGRDVSAVEFSDANGRLSVTHDLGLVGAPLTRSAVRAALTTLLETGAYSDVQFYVDPSRDPLVLEVRVVSRLRVVRVDVRGNEAMTDSEVRERLGRSEGADIARAEVPALVAALRAAYAEHGYASTEVELRVLDTGVPSEVVLLVELREGPPTLVSRVRVTGERMPEPSSLARPLRALEGERLDLEAIERAVVETSERLRDAGYYEARFDEPVVTRDGHRAVVEVPLQLGPVFTVEVGGAGPYGDDALVDALELEDAAFDSAGLATLREKARDYFLRRGYADARVAVEVVRDPESGVATLHVDAVRGTPVRIRRMRFEGNSQYDDAYLREQVESFLVDELDDSSFGEPVDSEVIDRMVGGREREAPRRKPETEWVAPEQRYYAPVFERALEHLSGLYSSRGYVDVRIARASAVRIDEDEVEVVIEVVEGPRALFFDVTVAGNQELDDRTLAEALDLDRGDPFSEGALAAAVERMLERYRDVGYLYAAVTQRVSFSEDRTRAVVELTVNERFPVEVRSIRIEGLRLTREPLVRSLVALEEGQPFTRELSRRTEERLLELGIFGSVVVSPSDAEVPEPVKDVVITVSERMPQVLDFGAGISTGQGVRGSFEYTYRNLFGRAITFSMRAQVSGQFFFIDPILQQRFETLSLQQRLERRITLGIVLPTIGADSRFRTSFNVLNLRDNAYKFGIDKSAFDVTVSFRPSRHVLLSASPSLERSVVGLLVRDETYDDVISGISDPSLRQLLRVPEGRSSLVSFATQVVVDHRNSALSPTRGAYISGSLEWARTLASQTVEFGGVDTRYFSHHLRLTVVGSTYVPLGGRVTLALQGRYGRILHLEDRSETFPNRQFFLGGVDTMRAYRQDAMVPQDIIDTLASEGEDGIPKTALVQGGDTYLLVRSELRFPLLGDISGAVFGEFGNLWADVANFEPWDLRPTAGFGIRLDTPVGPIALDYGFNILSFRDERQLVGERLGAFNFSIGVY